MKRVLLAVLVAALSLCASAQTSGAAGTAVAGGGTQANQANTWTQPQYSSSFQSAASGQWAAFGDSITAGNEDGTGITYPNELQSYTFAGQPVLNYGVGGQTSGQIAVRMNAYAGGANQQIGGFTIPTSGTVNVTFPVGYEPAFNLSGSLSGFVTGARIQVVVSGTAYLLDVVDNGSHVYVATPAAYPGSPVVVSANTQYTSVIPPNTLNGCVLVQAGRNDTWNPDTTLIANITAIKNLLAASTNCYMFQSILNGENEQKNSSGYNALIAASNDILAVVGAAHYLDIRAQMVAAYDPNNAADVLDHNEDVIPYSLRAARGTGVGSGTLSVAMASTSACTFTYGFTMSLGFIVKIDSELIWNGSGADGAYTGCIRGYAGTTAATHLISAPFTGVDSLHPGQSTQASSATNPNFTNGYIAMATGLYNWWKAAGQNYFLNADNSRKFGTDSLFNGSPVSPSLLFPDLTTPLPSGFYGELTNPLVPKIAVVVNGSIAAGWYTGGLAVESGRLTCYFATLGFRGAGTATSYGGTSGILDISNGCANGTSTGKLKASAFYVGGTKFTSNNGCSETTLLGGGSGGSYHSGTTGTCTVLITMGDTDTATNGWACYANDITTPADVQHQTAFSTTTATISGPTVSGDIVNFHCDAY